MNSPVPCWRAAWLAVMLVALAVSPAAAQAAAPDHRYEVTLVFGASLLSAETDSRPPFTTGTLNDFERFFPVETGLIPPGTLRTLLPETIRARERIGGSVLQGFQVARRFARRGWVETEFLLAPAHNLRRTASFTCPAQVCALLGVPNLGDALAVEERVVAYHYGLAFAYELTRGEVRPYLSVGAGAVTYDLPGKGDTSFAFQVGLGTRLGLGERLGGRVEVVDRIVPDHFLTGGTEHDVQVRAGLGFRLP